MSIWTLDHLTGFIIFIQFAILFILLFIFASTMCWNQDNHCVCSRHDLQFSLMMVNDLFCTQLKDEMFFERLSRNKCRLFSLWMDVVEWCTEAKLYKSFAKTRWTNLLQRFRKKIEDINCPKLTEMDQRIGKNWQELTRNDKKWQELTRIDKNPQDLSYDVKSWTSFDMF